MNESLAKKRDELVLELKPRCSGRWPNDFAWSAEIGIEFFNACHAEMQEREKKLVDALESYADKSGYEEYTNESIPGRPTHTFIKDIDNHGDTARTALKELGIE